MIMALTFGQPSNMAMINGGSAAWSYPRRGSPGRPIFTSFMHWMNRSGKVAPTGCWNGREVYWPNPRRERGVLACWSEDLRAPSVCIACWSEDLKAPPVRIAYWPEDRKAPSVVTVGWSEDRRAPPGCIVGWPEDLKAWPVVTAGWSEDRQAPLVGTAEWPDGPEAAFAFGT